MPGIRLSLSTVVIYLHLDVINVPINLKYVTKLRENYDRKPITMCSNLQSSELVFVMEFKY